jgi:predicted DNA-binding transcriptional regulator AlpA
MSSPTLLDQIFSKYPPLLNLQQVAEITNFSSKTLRNWISQSRCPFPFQRLGEKSIRIQASRLAEWIELGSPAAPVQRKRGRPRKISQTS